MIRTRYVSILKLLLLIMVISASCHTNQKNPLTQNIDGVQNASLDSLPEPYGHINDYENLFTYAEETTLDSLVTDFEKKTTIQIAVVTIDTTMTARADFDAFTLRLAQSWEIGQKEKNNGVLIGISKGYRKIRVNNGHGIEKMLTSEETKQVVDNVFIPSFRMGEYFAGTKKGLQALMSILASRTQ